MQFQETLKARHSIRYFQPTPLEPELLTAIVSEARWAPSWINSQEWRVTIATGETLEAIRQACAQRDKNNVKGNGDIPVTHREAFSETAQENMRLFSKAREDAGLAEVKLQSQAELFHAPAVCFLTVPKTYKPYVIFDLGAFSQTLMLAAAERGVGSVVAYNLVKYPDILRQHLPIREDEVVAIGIALGYAAKHPLNSFRSTRRAVEEILTIVK